LIFPIDNSTKFTSLPYLRDNIFSIIGFNLRTFSSVSLNPFKLNVVPPSIKLIYLTNTLFFSKFHNHLIVDTPKLMDINCISLNDLQVGGHPTNQIGFIW